MGCIIATENRKFYFWNVLYHNMKLSLCHMIYTEFQNWIQSVLVMSLHAKLLIFSTCDFRFSLFVHQKWARSCFVPQLNKASREKVLPMSQVWNRGCAADSATDSTKKGARFSVSIFPFWCFTWSRIPLLIDFLIVYAAGGSQSYHCKMCILLLQILSNMIANLEYQTCINA